MDYISQTTREKIATEANHRCEYCQTAQEISGAQMNIEHIVPLSRGGSSKEDNLCLACAWCNSYKWAKTHGRDPGTNEEIPLFNPRMQVWQEHFRWSDDGIIIIGISSIGQATVEALKMNNEYIIPARRHWVEAGWHPPSE
jgi:hypothetical protein